MVPIIFRLIKAKVLFSLFMLSALGHFHSYSITREQMKIGLPERQVAILMYHHINDFYAAKGNISTKLFIQHLNMLQKEGYHVISVDSYAKFLEGKGDIPRKSAIITFDDGYESFYKYAYPELSKRHLPATDFIIVGLVGKTNGNLHYLTWAQMKKCSSMK